MVEHLSFELSKKLYDSGMIMDSAMNYMKHASGAYHKVWRNLCGNDSYPAPTFLELWDLLPEKLLGGELHQWKYDNRTVLGYLKSSMTGPGMTICLSGTEPVTESHKHPIEAAGQLVLKLTKGGYLKC